MRTSRRELVTAGGILAAGAWLTGCKSIEQQLAPSYAASGLPDYKPATSVDILTLNRAGFGISREDLATINQIGRENWIDQQLAPDMISEPFALEWGIRSLGDILNADPGLLFDIDDRVAVKTLRQATLLRSVYSKRQLYERMVNFWTDHFNIYAFKGENPQYIVISDRETIRKHALGNFHDLLHASAESAAMMGYLDSASNVKGVPNENYARELFELHTLGLGGGYTQDDIRNAARCFTGWTTQQHWYRGRFQFDQTRHDMSTKSVLGVTIPAGGGQSDGERVLDIAGNHPSTAHFISRQLCRYFIGDEPQELITQLAEIFQTTHGEIKPVLRRLLLSDEFANAKPVFKRPLDYMASLLRATAADTDCGDDLQGHLRVMGQPLFEWPMPDGFPMRESAWINGLIPRWRFASALVSNQINNTAIDWDNLESRLIKSSDTPAQLAVELLFADINSHDELAHELSVVPGLRSAVEVAAMSPDFQTK